KKLNFSRHSYAKSRDSLISRATTQFFAPDHTISAPIKFFRAISLQIRPTPNFSAPLLRNFAREPKKSRQTNIKSRDNTNFRPISSNIHTAFPPKLPFQFIPSLKPLRQRL